MIIDEMLAYNKTFVAEKRYEQYATSKYPNKKSPSSPAWTPAWKSCSRRRWGCETAT